MPKKKERKKKIYYALSSTTSPLLDLLEVNSSKLELINEISELRRSRKGQIKDKNNEEKIINWQDHFQAPLGNPLEVDDEDEEITLF